MARLNYFFVSLPSTMVYHILALAWVLFQFIRYIQVFHVTFNIIILLEALSTQTV